MFGRGEPGPQEQPHPLARLGRVIDAVTMTMNVVGTLLIVAIMVLVNADVIGRSFFDAPISGVPEMVSMSIVTIVFLQVAQTFRMGRLTRSDAIPDIIERRSPRLRAILETLFCAGGIFILIELLLASWPLFTKSWVRNTYEGTIGDFTAPIWPVKMIIVIGCAALAIQLARRGIIAFLAAFGRVRLDDVRPT